MASAEDIFADLLMLIVPKAAAEYATWKYDVQEHSKLLTVYRLRYENRVAKVSDCVCLQFCCDASNPLGYSLLPTISASGNDMDSSYLPDVPDRKKLSSPLEFQKLLDHLDRTYKDRYRNKENHADHGDVVHYSVDTESPSPLPAKPSSTGRKIIRSPKVASSKSTTMSKPCSVRSKRTAEDNGTLNKKQKTMQSEGRTLAQPSTLVRVEVYKNGVQVPEVELRKSKKQRTQKEQKTKRQNSVKDSDTAAVTSLDDFVSSVPSLPLHPSSGGTICSSQYWKTSVDGRQRLNCTRDFFVDSGIVSSLPDLRETPVEKRFNESVKYGWQLLEHLLGGSEAISRSFACSLNESAPIGKEELLHHIDKIVDGIVEHLERSLSLDKTESGRKKIMQIVQWKMDSSQRPKIVVHKKSSLRQPSDMFLRDHLRQNSYPAARKVQIAFGFDLYLDSEKLHEIEYKYKEEYTKCAARVQDDRRWFRFGSDLIVELAGGTDIFREGLRRISKGLVTLVGDDIIEAAYDRTKKTFELDDSFTLLQFRTGVAESLAGYRKNVELNTGLMASILFPSGSNVRGTAGAPSTSNSVNNSAPAEPGCNYWTTPALHRTRLSSRFSVYMDTVRLAEYQRYLGPESARKNKDWNLYTWTLVQYAIGGEEALLRKLLELRKAGELLSKAVDSSVKDAIFDHVEDLYKLPEISRKNSSNKKRIRECTQAFIVRQLDSYDKGKTRWHFPELDGRPKPEALTTLEQQEYWRKPAPDRTQLRSGHDVYIRTKIVDSVAYHFGPLSKENCIKRYCFAMVVHMLGGPETAFSLRQSGKFSSGVGTMFLLDDLIAVCLYADSVFHLVVSINPVGCLSVVAERMSRMEKHKEKHEKRMTKGGNPRASRSVLKLALDIP